MRIPAVMKRPTTRALVPSSNTKLGSDGTRQIISRNTDNWRLWKRTQQTFFRLGEIIDFGSVTILRPLLWREYRVSGKALWAFLFSTLGTTDTAVLCLNSSHFIRVSLWLTPTYSMEINILHNLPFTMTLPLLLLWHWNLLVRHLYQSDSSLNGLGVWLKSA